MSVPAAYFAVVLIWSTTPLAIKWSGEGPGFLFGALGRMSLAVVLCVALIIILRKGLPLHRQARHTYASGGIAAYGSMLCVYWAAQQLPSGVINVLFGLTPLLTAILAIPLLGERGLTPAKLAGMATSLAGLVTIFGASMELGPSAVVGIAALFVAVALHALSLVLVKRYGAELPSLTVTSGALLIAVPLFAVTWLIFDGHAPVVLPARAAASIVYLGVIGSVVGFTLYFYLIKHVSANNVALITLVTPVAALFVGAAVNDEHVGLPVWLGTALVLTGLALHQWGGQLARLIPVFARGR
ncbi:MAG: DMT family transporter [Pseudomonadota bacterium]|nr:MAG: DMT family transporter [Pseudomonadota bacterium]